MKPTTTQERVNDHDELYRRLPSVNELLLAPEMQECAKSQAHERVVDATRGALAELRSEIAASKLSSEGLDAKLELLPERIAAILRQGPRYSLRAVINATGVLLHTNLGRAPLSESALAHVVETAANYSNLEFDLDTGERSRRDIHAERLVLRVLKVPEGDISRFGAVIVNNCAAATFLALNALAEKREVVVSRGELVEIGGGFRIPEILEKSGAVLREIGTTNRTRVSDYEQAAAEQTALLLRVHQSNFKMEGFVERPSLEELVSLAKTLGVPLFEDQGTGLLCSLDSVGITDQPTLRASIEAGVDLVAASGDKLLGGPQCGILVGRADLIARIRKSPLLRAFRVDKLTYAALEATLFDYLANPVKSIPVMQMLRSSAVEIEKRCRNLLAFCGATRLTPEIIEISSVVGGGTAPNARIKSYGIALKHSELSSEELLKQLRHGDPPIIARIADDRVVLDLRTVSQNCDGIIGRQLTKL